MTFEERMDPLDKLFLMISMFSSIVVGIATSLGLDLRLLWIPLLSYLGWSIYIYWYRGVYQLREEKERSLIERIRGLSYVIGFVITFTLNGCWIFYLDFIVDTTRRLVGSLAVIILVVILLLVITLGIPKTFFLKQTRLFSKPQMASLYKILRETGTVSIYFSVLIMTINSFKTVLDFLSPISIFSFLVFGFYSIKIHNAEKESRKLSHELALSLRKTRWLRKFLASQRRAKGKK